LIFAALSFSAHAATATANLAVTARLSATCTVGASALNFGSQTNVGAANIDAQATFTLTCTNGTPFAVLLGNGANFSGGTRRMNQGATNFVNYSLYLNAARTVLWPATGGTATGNGAAQSFLIFGRIPAGQPTAAPGAYADSVQLTVTY
jgi:spore coat protein U-like protein